MEALGPRLPAAILLVALAGACATARPDRGGPAASPEAPPPATAPRGGPATLAELVASPPELAWEATRKLPGPDYLHFPTPDGGPGFFLTRTGFHYLDADDLALRYERTDTGFSIVEVKKRFGESQLAQCPVYFPVENCVEKHYLLFATIVSCGGDCSYRFVVFDSHSEFPITLKDPAIFGVLKRLVDSWLPPPEIDVRFEESGSLAGMEAEWADYIHDRFAFIGDQIRSAEKPPGFRLLHTQAW